MIKETGNTFRDETPDEISNLPLSVRAVNGLKNAGILSLDKLLSLNETDLMNFKNIGRKTCEEILQYIQPPQFVSFDHTGFSGLKNIDEFNKAIPVSALKNIGLSSKGIEFLLLNNYKTVEDLCVRSIGRWEYSFVSHLIKYLSVSVVTHFQEDIKSLNDTEKICIMERCEGKTLQEIGDKIGYTRERVRQIVTETCRRLLKPADLIADILLSSYNNTFKYSQLQNIFSDDQTAQLCRLVLLESDNVKYFSFSKKFIRADICPSNIDQLLFIILKNVIGNGLNIHDYQELIKSEFKKHSLDFFEFDDIVKYLAHKGYRFYGHFVIKGKPSYADICHDVVKKFFTFDIKLDSDENNEDMRLLRQIVKKQYPGLKLKPSNRALTASIINVRSRMVLSGTGRYCPIEKAIYSVALFDDIRNYIHNSHQTSFYYCEIYAHFEERFLAETNIHNINFLHGMLKYLFPDEFSYGKDNFNKNNSRRQNVDDRIRLLFKQQGSVITKAEIKKTIPGISDTMIAAAIMRMPEVIQWNNDEYNHIDNIIFSPEDIISLKGIIEHQVQKHSGYCSDALLYANAKEKCYEFLKRNHIVNASNLYYLARYYFGKDYRFRRPHIVTTDFPLQELSIFNIARELLNIKNIFNYEEYCNLACNLGWGREAYGAFFVSKKRFIRVSANNYVFKDYFCISEKITDLLSDLLKNMVKETGYCALNGIINYDVFPECGYPWNEFLLESIITQYDIGFRIIYPKYRNLRYQKGIIVPKDSLYNSVEDIRILLGNPD